MAFIQSASDKSNVALTLFTNPTRSALGKGHGLASHITVVVKVQPRFQPHAAKMIIGSLDRDDPLRTCYLRERWQGLSLRCRNPMAY